MTHTSSAIKRATWLRTAYTGEAHQLALQAVSELQGTQQVVPDATSVHQRMLEARIIDTDPTPSTSAGRSPLSDSPPDLVLRMLPRWENERQLARSTASAPAARRVGA